MEEKSSRLERKDKAMLTGSVITMYTPPITALATVL
jgi:hypothetical protein